ncbi:uncharacterized protein LOC123007374 [Tribolium madens]|uniref:uncharacterized protein LOC123007374 n=1 Tax=Tribolium madens TaxID=41895 RepID=UPI001CF7272D|nr:uncharacterized protein LOC123007374 [Tribolium madens]
MFSNKLTLLLILNVFIGKFTESSREKRTLIWEPSRGRNSRLQIITGIGVPLDLQLETVVIGWIIKGYYRLPTNVSDIKPFGNVYYERRKRSLSRWDIYDLLAQMWQMRGFGGKSCILRAICELSHSPLDRNYGLFDELMHVVFSPSTTKEKVRSHSDNEYFAAQKLGRKSGESCKAKFDDCQHNLLDMFTI